jgi:GTP 3',8-cyclase
MACATSSPLQDRFGRRISYVRLSLTDRCDMRCRYCMAEEMTFLPRSEILSLEEIAELARQFVARGVTRIRLTGGEPLARRGACDVAHEIGSLIGHGLDELTLTTNASRLADHADALWDAGIRRINVSLDTRDADRFAWITRKGRLPVVLEGIEAARQRGFAIKINMVALNGLNDHEIVDMLAWCGSMGLDLSLIETMPLGEMDEVRTDRFFPLTEAMERIRDVYEVVPSSHVTGGPARYWQVPALGVKLGLISPLTNNFCATCNRVRVSASGMLYMCLGAEDHVDLKAALRSGKAGAVDALLDKAMGAKPERHHFDLSTAATQRHMNVTGG